MFLHMLVQSVAVFVFTKTELKSITSVIKSIWLYYLHVLIPGRHIPTFCHVPFTAYPDGQGTQWRRQPSHKAFADALRAL